jgi:hypothetical protein
MPRDDFARLERRWRERPLFLPRRRRLPWWALGAVLVALAATLTLSLLGPRPVERLVDSLGGAVNANAGPSTPPTGGSSAPATTADARLASPDGR